MRMKHREKRILPKIEPGVRVGKLTVKEATGQRKRGYSIWNCHCDCGGSIALDTRALQRGTVQDCGCETKVRPGQKDLTGQRFGRLVCLEPTEGRSKSSGSVIWHCRCDCGNECLVPRDQLMKECTAGNAGVTVAGKLLWDRRCCSPERPKAVAVFRRLRLKRTCSYVMVHLLQF